MRDRDLALLEVGPGAALTSSARRSPDATPERIVQQSMRHPQASACDIEFLLNTLATLWTHGVPVDWEAFNACDRRRRVRLPTYPFERRRYWVDAAPARPEAPTAPVSPDAPGRRRE